MPNVHVSALERSGLRPLDDGQKLSYAATGKTSQLMLNCKTLPGITIQL